MPLQQTLSLKALTGSHPIPPPVFIGDELTATGYRLGGAQVYSPRPEEAAVLFRRLFDEAGLILLSVEYARMLPAAELDEALRALKPLVVIVPDARNRFAMRDMPARLRRTLGVSV